MGPESENGIHLRVARCSGCSLNADTSKYGYFLSVNNCNPKTIEGVSTHVCDVTINNRSSRYVCKQVNSISDCVDRLSYCRDGTFDNNNEDMANFCNSVIDEQESHTELGDQTFYILDGHIMWNLQMEVSKCGTSRTSIRNSEGGSWPSDQRPNCLPYSDVFMDNRVWGGEHMKCPDGELTMMETVCNDEDCTPSVAESSDCCIMPSNCSSSVKGCEPLRESGIKICGDQGTSDMEMCGNPCASIVNIPELGDGARDTLWHDEICGFFCPTKVVQDFWFKNSDEDYGDTPSSRVCSEEYFNLCRLAGCNPDQNCKVDWGEQAGVSIRDYPEQYPVVYKFQN